MHFMQGIIEQCRSKSNSNHRGLCNIGLIGKMRMWHNWAELEKRIVILGEIGCWSHTGIFQNEDDV